MSPHERSYYRRLNRLYLGAVIVCYVLLMYVLRDVTSMVPAQWSLGASIRYISKFYYLMVYVSMVLLPAVSSWILLKMDENRITHIDRLPGKPDIFGYLKRYRGIRNGYLALNMFALLANCTLLSLYSALYGRRGLPLTPGVLGLLLFLAYAVLVIFTGRRLWVMRTRMLRFVALG